MNARLRDITFTARDGQVSQLDAVYVRGSKIRCAPTPIARHTPMLPQLAATLTVSSPLSIRFYVLPDMLKNAPMFKKAASKGQTVTRGKSAILRAQGWRTSPRLVALPLPLPGFVSVPSPHPWWPFVTSLAAAKQASRGRGAAGRGQGHQYR
jgi:small nuclear ribonucleoprotein D3